MKKESTYQIAKFYRFYMFNYFYFLFLMNWESQALQMSFVTILEDERIIGMLGWNRSKNRELMGWFNNKLIWSRKSIYMMLVDLIWRIQPQLRQEVKKSRQWIETRKCYGANIADIADIADRLHGLICEESGAYCSSIVWIISQVSDILDQCNSHIKNRIELKTILDAYFKWFKA